MCVICVTYIKIIASKMKGGERGVEEETNEGTKKIE